MLTIRKEFPLLSKKIAGKSIIYFDNSATTQKPASVIKSMSDFYTNFNANVHRSMNPLAEKATHEYESVRELARKFINARGISEIIFTSGTTESINLVAQTWGRKNLVSGDRVVLPISEHHSNIVPWLQLKKEKNIILDFIPLKDGKLDKEYAIKALEAGRVKLLTISSVSNTLGIINPVQELISIAKKKGIITLVDGAQSVSHVPTDVQKLGCDFFAFSAHKMYGPTGVGVLYGEKELLEEMLEWKGGGDMIHEVFTLSFSVNELPYKFEAGTPNIAGVIGLGAAIKWINKVGFTKITGYEKELTRYLLKSLRSLHFVKIIGDTNVLTHVPLFSIGIKGVHPHDMADLLGNAGIMIRAGHHCTQPLHNALNLSASARISLAVYNTKREVDILVKELKKIYTLFN